MQVESFTRCLTYEWASFIGDPAARYHRACRYSALGEYYSTDCGTEN